MDKFQRNIALDISREENLLIARSTMTDQFHDIRLMVAVDFDTLVIKDIELIHHRAPTPTCCGIVPKMDSLIGCHVGKGLTRKVFEATSGSEGCINIRNLLLASLPLVLNLKAGSGIEEEAELIPKMAEEFDGSCVGYNRNFRL